MNYCLQLRRGTAAQWAASSRVLSPAEPGVDLDTGELRLGDGVHLWPDLPDHAGPQGPPGDKGATGDQGPVGDQGLTGDKGPAGDQGASGDQGATGDQGPVGDKGATGDQGPVGDQGATGDRGPVGDKGATGDQGPPGNPATCWPLGSVFVSVVETNPATLLGIGTWASIGAGRVLIGRDGSDPDFDTAEETGGAKTVAAAGSNAAEAAHTHPVTSNVAVGQHDEQTTSTPDLAAKIGTAASQAASAVHTHTVPALTHSVTNNAVTSGAGASHTHAFSGSATSVVQPYVVVYMWKRTA